MDRVLTQLAGVVGQMTLAAVRKTATKRKVLEWVATIRTCADRLEAEITR